MLYENLVEWKVYPAQSRITFPRKNEEENKLGFGNVIFMLTPNMESSLELIMKDHIALKESLYKFYIIESIYREKIGMTRVMLNERQKMKKSIPDNFDLNYIPSNQIKTVLNKKKNCVVDLGRWMELFFNYYIKKTPEARCRDFITFLASKINDDNYEGYSKILLLDITTWVSNTKECILMNPKLLNNPLSIIIYSMYKYPELIQMLGDIKLYLIDSTSKQVFLTKFNELDKKIYPKFKAKVKLFKSVIVSEEEESKDPNNNSIKKIKSAKTRKSMSEIKAENIEKVKEDILKQIRFNLLGDEFEDSNNSILDEDEDDLSFLDDEFDITNDIDELKSINDSENNNISEDEEEFLDPEEKKEIEEKLANGESSEDIIKSITTKARDKRYLATFKVARTTEQDEKVHRMMHIQDMALNKVKDDKYTKESKIIDEKEIVSFIKTTNPDINKTKMANFDKNYVEKKMQDDIDNSVTCLSNASQKIFVINKEVKDSSDSMNLKKTYTYNLEDEKGNKMTIKFDVPEIIDNNYIYINGSKKLIGHQFVLKPLVKTAPDTVQLVTHYNKAFITRDGIIDEVSNNILKYITTNKDLFKVEAGNCRMRNKKYDTPLDFDSISKSISSFKYKDYVFYMDIDRCIEVYNKKYPNDAILESQIKTDFFPIGFNVKSKEVFFLNSSDSFSSFILDKLDESDKNAIGKMKSKPRLSYVKIKLMSKIFPIVLIMLYCEGFSEVMRKANVKYEFIDPKVFRNIDKLKYDYIPLKDKVLIWERNSLSTMLLMNGLKKCDLNPYTSEDLESKDTYRDLVEMNYGNASINFKLDQFYDFMLDDVTKEILEDMGYPTNLIELMIIAVNLLCDSNYLPENNMTNMRIRSNEVIANIIYKQISDAYTAYRKTSYKKKPSNVSIKQSAIIDELLSSETNLIEEFSVINPVLEIEKARCVTYKGLRGIQLDRAITLPKRGFDPSMLGVVGISTPPDANVGVNRQMTLEPNITSTRGYLDPGGIDKVDELSSVNLLTPAELLNPLGVIHDDPDRTAIKKCLLDVAV